ncbi:MAG TPA: FtsQ-type POTRA domain-containing protein [Acidimicrobiia bacterium]
MTMDPRLAERRKEVAEERAKRTVRRLLRFLSAIGLAGLVVWFLLSPYMSAREVVVEGAAMAAVKGILSEHSVVPGRPLVLIRPGSVEHALEQDPWVADAEVDLVWPDDVVVRITERVPRAWVETVDGWTRRDEDAVALPSEPEPDETLGRVRLADMDPESEEDRAVITGAIEFLMTLPQEMAVSSQVRWQDDELWANVDGWEVRLGRADEMRQKALSLVTLLEQEELAEGSLIVLIAPTHPSVLPPDSPAEEEESGEDGESGEGTEDAGTAGP